MEEKWKTIEWNQDYQVSNMGRVKSLKYGKERILKQNKLNNGYVQVILYDNEGKTKGMLVHRLVATAFVQNDSLFNNEVNHIDENPLNNCASNLEWCDHIYNINFGTRNERAGKSISKRVICLETGIVYPSAYDVQRQLRFSQSHICDCCKGKRNTCGGYHWRYVE